MFTTSMIFFMTATMLGVPQDPFDYQQHQNQLEAIRFESALLLWSCLDEKTRLSYYNETLGGGASVASNFESFKSQKASGISESQQKIAALKEEKEKIYSEAADKSQVKVEKIAAVAAAGSSSSSTATSGSASGSAAGVAAGAAAIKTETSFSQTKYDSLIGQESSNLKSIDQDIQAHEKIIAQQKARIDTSSAYAANAVAAAENESAYIANLETALQNGLTPTLRYRRLQTFESDQPHTDETLNVVFDNPGRIIIQSDGIFKVTAKNTKNGQVTGVTNRKPKYRHFCVIDSEPGDTYSIRIQTDTAFSATIEELR